VLEPADIPITTPSNDIQVTWAAAPVARAGETARFSFLVHSHMLTHSWGYKLANDGQDTRAIQHYLGHRSIASTVSYTALAPDTGSKGSGGTRQAGKSA
jgi:site-specific recombinase XerD